jgi:flagellin-like protein
MVLKGSRSQKGITGLKTAIVLIAFVVVASAFAFSGYVGSTRAVNKIVFVVQNSLAGEPADLTPPYTYVYSGTDPDIVNVSNAAKIVSYADENQRLSDVP